MNTHWNNVKNIVLVCTIFFLFCTCFAYSQTAVKVTLLDNTEQNYSVQISGKLWFTSTDLIINTDDISSPTVIHISNIRKITFDGNGGTSVSDLIKNQDVIRIFPNPAKDYFDIESQGTTELNVHIYNTNGMQVANGIYRSGNRVDISHLSTGIYIVVINNQSFKFIKQ